jgi:hypothetical protein
MKNLILLIITIVLFAAPVFAEDLWPDVADDDKKFCIQMGKTAQIAMAQRYKGHSSATLKSGTDNDPLHTIIDMAFERPYITDSYADQQKEINEFGYRVFGICMDNININL